MNRKKIKIPAFAYLRVSGTGQMSGHGFDRQAETINTYAAEHGYVVEQTFRDAFTGTEADRPEFTRMVAAILATVVARSLLNPWIV
jgi:DNA invertase Pin-like site-specific DNA recombinase